MSRKFKYRGLFIFSLLLSLLSTSTTYGNESWPSSIYVFEGICGGGAEFVISHGINGKDEATVCNSGAGSEQSSGILTSSHQERFKFRQVLTEETEITVEFPEWCDDSGRYTVKPEIEQVLTLSCQKDDQYVELLVRPSNR